MKSYLTFYFTYILTKFFYYILIYCQQERVKSKTSRESIGVGKSKCNFKFFWLLCLIQRPLGFENASAMSHFCPRLIELIFTPSARLASRTGIVREEEKLMAKNCAIIFLCGKERGQNYTGNACENFAMYCKKSRDIKETCKFLQCVNNQ